MIRRLTLACAGLALCAAGATPLFAADPQTVAAGKAADYVRTLQQTDGGFPDFSTGSSPGATIDATFALASTGVDPLTVRTGGKSPADYLASQALAYSATAGGAAKLVLGVATLNLDAGSFGGIDPLAVMEANYNGATGQYGADLFAQAYFMLAEASLHRPVPPAARSFVEGAQKADGGWEDCCAFGEDTNTTALVVRALIAGGAPTGDQHIVNGLAYLRASQQADGGFPYAAPGASDANSTAFAIQAIIAGGQSVDAGGPWETSAGKTPLSALLGFQNSASGALQYFGADSPFATYQGIPGLMLAAFPERPASEQAATLTAIAAASTATATPTPSRTPSSTPSTAATTTVRTSTPTQRSTDTPANTSSPAPATATAARSVLGEAVAPPRVPSSLPLTRLPDTGSAAPRRADAGAWLLLLLSGAMSLAGAAMLWRGAR